MVRIRRARGKCGISWIYIFDLLIPVVYPPLCKMIAYGEFRTSYDMDTEDQRILLYGIRYIIENYIHKKWTREDVEKAEGFFSMHMCGEKPYPFPKELFLKVRNNIFCNKSAEKFR